MRKHPMKYVWIALGCISLGVGFLLMHRIPIGRIILAVIWVFHLLYFIFGFKTLKE